MGCQGLFGVGGWRPRCSRLWQSWWWRAGAPENGGSGGEGRGRRGGVGGAHRRREDRREHFGVTTAVDVGGARSWGRRTSTKSTWQSRPRCWRSGRGVHGGGGRGRRGRGAIGSSRRRGNLGSESNLSRPRSGIKTRTLTLGRATCPTASGAGIPQDREGLRGSGHDRRAGGGVRPPAHGGRDQPARRGGDRPARAGGPPHGLGRVAQRGIGRQDQGRGGPLRAHGPLPHKREHRGL